jgi:hypothetical protein
MSKVAGVSSEAESGAAISSHSVMLISLKEETIELSGEVASTGDPVPNGISRVAISARDHKFT